MGYLSSSNMVHPSPTKSLKYKHFLVRSREFSFIHRCPLPYFRSNTTEQYSSRAKRFADYAYIYIYMEAMKHIIYIIFILRSGYTKEPFSVLLLFLGTNCVSATPPPLLKNIFYICYI